MKHNFLELSIWKESIEQCADIYTLVSNFSDFEKFGLSSQMTRSAVSIPSNIAEGCGRGSTKDLNRFLNISLGSCFELETQLHIVKKVYPEFKNESSRLIHKNRAIQRKIGGFKRFIQNQNI
jgi:four helix bundle protein